MRRRSSKETSQKKKWWSKVDLQKGAKIRRVHQGLIQKEGRVRKNVGSVENFGISRRIVGKY